MATQRLLFAINHKDTEDKIAAQVKSKCLCVGAVTYREAVVPAILENHADIVLIRDTLGGSLKLEDMVRQIRMECPSVRIIFLSSLRQKGDPLISALVSYGVYDIIISDAVQLQTIVSYIISPRNFRDVAAYFRPLAVEETVEAEPKEKKPSGGLFGGLFGRHDKQGVPTPPEQEKSATGINMDALRASMQEEANRKAQQGIQAVIDQAVEQKTKDLKKELDAKEAALEAANASLQSQARSEATYSRKLEDMRNELEAMEKTHAEEKADMEKIKAEYEKRLLSTKSAHDPEWFLQRSEELEGERDKLKNELASTKKEVERLKQSAQAVPNAPRVDYSLEDGSIVLPDTEEATPANPTDNHVLLFVGAKHGVGNTTAALNTAAMLAADGHKTLLIELNSHFPMLNHYFELTNLTAGIDTACKGAKEGNYRAVEAAIVKPHALSPSNRGLGKAYKKLPGGLHFLLFSNQYLFNPTGMEVSAFKDMVYALLMQMKYSYIVIDVQADEPELFNMCVDSGFVADKLVITLSQDSHAIASTGYMVTAIAKTATSKLLRDAVFVVNQYMPNLDPKLNKVAKYLSTGAKQCLALGLDRAEYVKAAMGAVPYIYNSGQTAEYRALAEAVKR